MNAFGWISNGESGNPLPTDTWLYVAIVRRQIDEETFEWNTFINGTTSPGHQSTTGTAMPDAQTWLIAERQGGPSMRGLIDEIRLDYVALTEAELGTLCDDEPVGVGPFIRGDCGRSGTATPLPGALTLLNYAYRGGESPRASPRATLRRTAGSTSPTPCASSGTPFSVWASRIPPSPDCATSALDSDVALGCAIPSRCP